MTITFSKANLLRSHEVWFRTEPKRDGFWDTRLVKHELDHVRISANPVIEKSFLKSLRENRVLRHTLTGGQRVSDTMVQDLVDQHVESICQETVSLVSIRYKELDRITKHGLQPIEPDSKLNEWFQ